MKVPSNPSLDIVQSVFQMREIVTLTRGKDCFMSTGNHLEATVSSRRSLLRNSVFQMVGLGLASLGGFLFWMVAARLCSAFEVGLAAALIAYVSLPVSLARMGMDWSLIRFFPSRDKGMILSTTLVVCLLVSLVVGAFLFFTVEKWSPDLAFIRGYPLLFFFTLAAFSVYPLLGTAFIAIRKSEFYVFQNLTLLGRVALVPAVASLGAVGLFASFGAVACLAVVFSISVLPWLGIRFRKVDLSYLRESLRFSLANYASGMLLSLPILAVPILVLNSLGPESTAIYYITYSIASLLYIVPTAVATALLVEGSHGRPLHAGIRQSLALSYCFLLPAIALLWIFGGHLLRYFGQDYSTGLELLKMLSLASLFVAGVSLFFSVKKVQIDLVPLIAHSVMISVIVISASVAALPHFGLVGVGYAWLLGYGSSAVFGYLSLVLNRRNRSRTQLNS